MFNRIRTCAKKLKAIDYLGNKCQICNEKSYYKLCFHHKNENEKDFDWSSIRDKSWLKIENELNKCILLCYNCHHEIHSNDSSHNKNNKDILLEYKNITGCEICGYNKNIGSLDFHHTDPTKKDFEISSITGKWGLLEIKKEIEEELNKCQVLCKNCHMELHYNDGFLEENFSEIKEKSENLKTRSSKIDVNLVLKLYEEGKKQIEIANEIGCVKSAISNILKKFKIK